MEITQLIITPKGKVSGPGGVSANKYLLTAVLITDTELPGLNPENHNYAVCTSGLVAALTAARRPKLGKRAAYELVANGEAFATLNAMCKLRSTNPKQFKD